MSDEIAAQSVVNPFTVLGLLDDFGLMTGKTLILYSITLNLNSNVTDIKNDVQIYLDILFLFKFIPLL